MSAAASTPREAPAAWREHTAALGMWVFLATEAMFFGALLLAYAHARLADPAGFAAASGRTHAWLGTANTAILLTSSLAVALAVRAAQLGRRDHVRRGLAAGAAMGAAFLAIKAREYGLEWSDGLVPGLRPGGLQGPAAQVFFLLYFVATGIHAVHLAVGIVLLGSMAWMLRGPPMGEARVAAVEVAGLYWHFVDAVWIVLYPLLYLPGLSR